MTAHLEERLEDFVLGELSGDERAAAEAHLEVCGPCRRAHRETAEVLAALALSLPAELPPPLLRERVLGEAKPLRLQPMLDRLTALFEVSRSEAVAMAERFERPSEWVPGPVVDSWVQPLPIGGPQSAGAFCGFVKMGAGLRWPPHRHRGLEHMLVLEGGFRLDDGGECHVGDLLSMEEGTSHGFTIFEDEPCVAAVVVFGGIDLLQDPVDLGGRELP